MMQTTNLPTATLRHFRGFDQSNNGTRVGKNTPL